MAAVGGVAVGGVAVVILGMGVWKIRIGLRTCKKLLRSDVFYAHDFPIEYSKPDRLRRVIAHDTVRSVVRRY